MNVATVVDSDDCVSGGVALRTDDSGPLRSIPSTGTPVPAVTIGSSLAVSVGDPVVPYRFVIGFVHLVSVLHCH